MGQLADALGLDLTIPRHRLQVQQSLKDRLAMVFLLCEPKAAELKVDADEFEERLQSKNSKGEIVVDAASDCFLEELIDFFRRFGQEAEAILVEKQLQSQIEVRKTYDEMIESGRFSSAMDEETNLLIQRLTGMLGDTSKDSSQSPEEESTASE